MFQRWICPPTGPAATPDKLAEWAAGSADLLTMPGTIRANRRDLVALQGTLLGPRVALPEQGVVQAGTLWVDAEVA